MDKLVVRSCSLSPSALGGAFLLPMPRRRCASPAEPAPLPLRVNDMLFLTEYLRNGRNATRAYMVVHPKAKYTSAESSAHDLLSKPKVQQELARRVQAEGGITKEMVESTLLQALAWANEKHDHLAVASIGMDCAKLAGFLVEKRQDITPPASLNEDQLREALRVRGFVPVPVN